jgi:hypothetical protein
MPHIIDQDLHFIAPAYGCVYTLKPYTSLSRVPFLFDHSQLPTFMSAVSIFTMGEIDKTEHFYSRARKVANKYPKKLIQKLWGSIPFSNEIDQEKWLLKEKKIKFSARIPHFFMGALSLLLIAKIVRKITGSVPAGILAAIFTLSPGLFVRFSSGGWTSSIILILLSVMYTYLYEDDKSPLFLFGILGGLINQKTVIAVASVFFTDICMKKIKNFLYIFSGWMIGIMLVSLYGLLLNWNCFLHAFFMDHGITRMLDGTANISGFFASWTRTFLYMNPVLFLLGIACVIYFTVKKKASPGWIIPVWFWTGSMIFILSAWPNARNAAITYPAIQICLVSGLWKLSNIRVRKALILIVSAVFLINIWLMAGTFPSVNDYYALNECGNTPVSVLNEYRENVLAKKIKAFTDNSPEIF